VHMEAHLWYDLVQDSFKCVTDKCVTLKCATLKCVTGLVCLPQTHPTTWLIHMCKMAHHICNMTNPYVCGMTYSHVWHDLFIRATCIIHMCDLTRSYVWRDSFICVTWLTHMLVTWHVCICDITRSHVWHDSFICSASRKHQDLTQMSYIWMSHVVGTNKSCHTYEQRHVTHCQHVCLSINMYHARCMQASPCMLSYSWPIHMCDMTGHRICDMAHSYVWYDSQSEASTFDAHSSVTSLIHMCDVTHLYSWHESIIYHMCDKNHSRKHQYSTHL